MCWAHKATPPHVPLLAQTIKSQKPILGSLPSKHRQISDCSPVPAAGRMGDVVGSKITKRTRRTVATTSAPGPTPEDDLPEALFHKRRHSASLLFSPLTIVTRPDQSICCMSVTVAPNITQNHGKVGISITRDRGATGVADRNKRALTLTRALRNFWIVIHTDAEI